MLVDIGTGNTVVAIGKLVTEVEPSGQFVTVGAQEVMVYVFVL